MKKLAQASPRPREALMFPRQRLGGAQCPQGSSPPPARRVGGESRQGPGKGGSRCRSEHPAPALAGLAARGGGVLGGAGPVR